jgi:hypothetical protein
MATPAGIRFIQQRIAGLRQLERQLRDQFAQASPQHREELELMLVTVVTDILELESALTSDQS